MTHEGDAPLARRGLSYDELDPARFRPKIAYSWDPPEALRSGGRSGWPAILSSLKSVLETGKPLVIKLERPKGMMELVSELAAAKP